MKNDLERLSGILKGLIVYKEEQELLKKLIKKYRYESVKLVQEKYPTDCYISAIGWTMTSEEFINLLEELKNL